MIRKLLFSKLGLIIIVFVIGFFVMYFRTSYEVTYVNPRAEQTDVIHNVMVWWYQQKVASCYRLKTDSEMYTCTNGLLRIIAQQYGARFALDVVEPLTPIFQPLMEHSHLLGHTIGDFAVFRNNVAGKNYTEDQIIQNLGQALVECDGWGSFGCYHGVIESGLAHIAPPDRARVVRKACLENPLITSRLYFENQCLHWFGHGMAIFTDQTLLQTLEMCEGVDPNFESDPVQLCLSGVFHAGALPGTSDPTYLGNIARVFKPGDPYYPCLTIPDRFRGQCFSQVVGRSQTPDPVKELADCDGIPETDPVKYDHDVRVCYETVGNSLLDWTKNNPSEIAQICNAHANPKYIGYCFTGPSRYSTLRNPLLTNTLSFEICQAAPVAAKQDCYAGIGFGNFENYKSQTTANRYCQKAEPAYILDCENRSYD